MRHAIFLLVVLCGCSGGVTLQFQHATPGVARQGLNERSPAALGLKVLAVYLSEDLDAQNHNVGATELIWLNPACAEDLKHCELGAGTSPDDGQPYAHFVSDYFDFTASTEQVNAAIAAQQRAVAPGTYRYTRVEFCKGNPSRANTARWSLDGENVSEFDMGGCSATAAIGAPLVVGPSDDVVVTLAYDLSAAVSDPPGVGPAPASCVAGGCLQVPEFTPFATLTR